MKSLLMVTHQKKNSQIINAGGNIHRFNFSVMGHSGLDICRKVSAGLQGEKDERTEVLCISAHHQLQQWRFPSLLCPGASALSTSQEGPVVYGSWSSTSIPVSMPQLFPLLNRETLWSQIQRSICLRDEGLTVELLVFEFLDLGCPV